MAQDARLNFFSELFNPLMALQTKGVVPPRPNMRPLDTVSKCRVLLPDERGKVQIPQRPQPVLPKKPELPALRADVSGPKESAEVPPSDRAQRGVDVQRALVDELYGNKPETLPEKPVGRTPASPTAAAYFGNLADVKSVVDGPMRLLTEAFKRRSRVRVVIRSAISVRGSCTGFLVAFDKHWNLILSDVRENYIVKRVERFPDRRAVVHDEQRTRHVPTLFVRGDQIVLVHPCDP